MTTYALPISSALAEQLAHLPEERVQAAAEMAAQVFAEALQDLRSDEEILAEPIDDETLAILRESIEDVRNGGKLYTLDEVEATIRATIATKAAQRSKV